jgi:hypothetical protein
MARQKIPQGKSNIATGWDVVRKKTKKFTGTVAAIAIAALSIAMLASRPSTAAAQQANEPGIDGDDIGGVVSGPNGRVWGAYGSRLTMLSRPTTPIPRNLLTRCIASR